MSKLWVLPLYLPPTCPFTIWVSSAEMRILILIPPCISCCLEVCTPKNAFWVSWEPCMQGKTTGLQGMGTRLGGTVIPVYVIHLAPFEMEWNYPLRVPYKEESLMGFGFLLSLRVTGVLFFLCNDSVALGAFTKFMGIQIMKKKTIREPQISSCQSKLNFNSLFF